MDSGIFEFRDPQGNLALSAHVNVDGHDSHHLVTYVVIAVVAVVLGLCCCFCCRRKCCCKKNKSAATEGSAVTFHDKSDSATPPPAVYYHGTSRPAGPSYPIRTSSGYTPYPENPPAYTQAVVSIEQPLQPNTAVYPPQPASAYPLQPASVNPPQPEPSLYPPLSEFGPPASQGSAAAPTFSSDAFFPDAEPRFQLKGLAFPSAPPLSSDAPTCDVYNSDKLNFL
ncbi:PREDICTED: lysine-rich arabinogalactan protein 19-like isoform X2 [Poecilia mexicana]|uniref:lysine-rich arabinogalactan protein 19-like isoform X2 n=1 Tax=Poecilia mexicana TaxID=48701 RepID=UPI00072E9E35|nr:PREDICTED: lysine-rich arabinogalactan protein 19-like isoform X2 [Poecilia mexicana]